MLSLKATTCDNKLARTSFADTFSLYSGEENVMTIENVGVC